MKVLLDRNIPIQLKGFLKDHVVVAAREKGWDRLRNGELLSSAEEAGFEVFLTGDQGIPYQHTLGERRLGFVVLTRTRLRLVLAHGQLIGQAIANAAPGTLQVLVIRDEPPQVRALE